MSITKKWFRTTMILLIIGWFIILMFFLLLIVYDKPIYWLIIPSLIFTVLGIVFYVEIDNDDAFWIAIEDLKETRELYEIERQEYIGALEIIKYAAFKKGVISEKVFNNKMYKKFPDYGKERN